MPRPLQIALVQLAPRKSDLPASLARFERVFGQLGRLDPRPALAVFAETNLTGYFLEGGVGDVARPADAVARDLNHAFRRGASGTLDVVVGFYELHADTYYNSAMYVTLGSDEPIIAHVHRKLFLPTYGLFDEERFVEHGLEIRAFDTPWGRAAMLVCEDLWHSMTGTIAALDGAQIIVVPSASPARGAWPQPDEEVRGPASIHRWERLARDRAEEHGVFVAVAQLVGTEGGKVFPGGSVLAGPHGDVRARAPLWSDAIVPVTIDLDDIARARAGSPLLADLRTMIPHLAASLRRTLPQND